MLPGGGLRTHKLLLLLASTCLIVLGTLAATWGRLPAQVADSGYYIALAQGQLATVPKPFSNRLLLPFVVRGLASTRLLSLNHAFVLWSILALVTLALVLGAIFLREGINPLWIVALLFTPYTLSAFSASYLPDLFQAALLALAILLLARRRTWLLLLVLFLAVTAREATMLAIVALAYLAWRQRRSKLAMTSVIVGAAGMALVAICTLGAPGNEHGLPTLAYLLFKAPYNGLKNLFGVELWTNTFARLPAWRMKTPSVVLTLPHWLQLGRVRALGLMPWHPQVVLDTFAIMLTAFGVWPAVWWGVRRRTRLVQSDPKSSELWLRWVLVYGLLAFALAPFLGASVERLVGYGWPAFWIAAPVLLDRLKPSQKTWRILMIWSLTIAWIPTLLGHLGAQAPYAMIVTILVAASSWVVAVYLIQKTGRTTGPLAPTMEPGHTTPGQLESST